MFIVIHDKLSVFDKFTLIDSIYLFSVRKWFSKQDSFFSALVLKLMHFGCR